MNSERNPFLFAFSVGVGVAVVFLIAFVALLFAYPDPQNAIGLFLSPFFAAWVGSSAALIALGWQGMTRPNSVRGLNSVFSLLLFVLGIVGLILITMFLASEFYQASHPTVVG